MSRRERFIPPPAEGLSHKIHAMRSFTGVVALGDFGTPEPVTQDFDLANFSYTGNSYTTLDGGPDVGFAVSPDGLHLFSPNGNNNTVYHHAITTPWDITTVQAFDASKSFAAQVSQLRGICFKPDGTKVYIGCRVNDRVYQYSLSTPWDITTATYDSKSLDFSLKMTEVGDIFWANDGAQFFLAEVTTGVSVVHEYSCSTAYDLSTASFVQEVDVYGVNPDLGEISGLYGIRFNPDGTAMYLTNEAGANDRVQQYALSTPYDASTKVYGGKFLRVSTEIIFARSAQISPNGVTIWVGDDQVDKIFAYQSSAQSEPDSGVTAAKSSSAGLTDANGNLFYIPRGAIVVRVFAEVIEGFQGDTTAVAVVGDADDEDRYVVASFDVKSQGVKQTGKPSGNKHHDAPKNPKVKVTAGNAFGNLTGGIMAITVAYIEP